MIMDGFYTLFGVVAFKVEVSVGLWYISGMMWRFPFFIRMSKNGTSFKLCSTVNFILG